MEPREILEFQGRLVKREIKDLKGTRDQLGSRVPEALKEIRVKEVHLVKRASKVNGVTRVSKEIWVKKDLEVTPARLENQVLKVHKEQKVVKDLEVKLVHLAL